MKNIIYNYDNTSSRKTLYHTDEDHKQHKGVDLTAE